MSTNNLGEETVYLASFSRLESITEGGSCQELKQEVEAGNPGLLAGAGLPSILT